MKKQAFLFLAIVCIAAASGQKLYPVPAGSTALEADGFAGCDKFGFFYAIKNNAFCKYKDGKSIEYKNVSLGKISKIDLQNPLKILLFYEAFNTAVTLDNQLNETQKIDFSQASPALLVTATGMASQNRLWFYDSLSQRIGLWDYLKNTYAFLTPPLQAGPKYHYGSDFNYFQWIDEKYNWYACDNFGKIALIAKVPPADRFFIDENRMLLFSEGRNLYLLSPSNNKKYALENIDKTFESFFLKEQILSIFTGHGITNYKITIP